MYTVGNAVVFGSWQWDRVDGNGPYRERHGRARHDPESHPPQANKRERMTQTVVSSPPAGGGSYFPRRPEEYSQSWHTVNSSWPLTNSELTKALLQAIEFVFICHAAVENPCTASLRFPLVLTLRDCWARQVFAPSLWGFCPHCFLLDHLFFPFAQLNATDCQCLSLVIAPWKPSLIPRKQHYASVLLAE